MSLRFDPRDITTIWVYRYSQGREEFLTRAHAQGLETEKLALDEAELPPFRLKIPSLWEFGKCDRCGLSFAQMGSYQKPVYNSGLADNTDL